MRVSSAWRLPSVGVVLGAALVAVMASLADAQTVEEVIEKNLKAQGGREALLNLKSLARKGTVAVDGTFGQMEGSVQEVVIPWKKVRRSLDLAVFVQDDGFDGTTAWRDGMMGLQDLEGDEANQIKQAVDLNPFVKLAERETTAEKLEDETIDDKAYYVVQLSPKDKPKVKIFIDKETGQIARSTLTQNNPMFGEIEIVVETSGYEAFGPVTLATKSKVALGEILQISTTFTETKVDDAVDEKIFEKPKEEEKPKEDAKPKEDDKSKDEAAK